MQLICLLLKFAYFLGLVIDNYVGLYHLIVGVK